MLRKIVLFLITSGVAARAWQRYSDRRLHRREQRLDRSAVQRWEDEGGPPA
jgi:membrane protein implicated in regulation of membrane protease activity